MPSPRPTRRALADNKAQVTPAIAALAADITRTVAAPRARWPCRTGCGATSATWACMWARAAWSRMRPRRCWPTAMATARTTPPCSRRCCARAGIASTAVLLNNGNTYRLPEVPTMGIFNHVINFIPALDLYLDPTAGSIAISLPA
ncbi:hypothetical protein LP420_16665 [Massilia sp. B-10]|nr:hypothetical protein LP420_16665 [Massilia sp. B-10]